MSLLINIPTLLYLLIIYNVVIFSGFDTVAPILLIPMISGHQVPFDLNDLFIFLGVLGLYIETLKSIRTSTATFVEHAFSLLTFVAYLVEFLLVKAVATSTFFLLMLMQLVDILAGLTISIQMLRQYGSFGPPYFNDNRNNR